MNYYLVALFQANSSVMMLVRRYGELNRDFAWKAREVCTCTDNEGMRVYFGAELVPNYGCAGFPMIHIKLQFA